MADSTSPVTVSLAELEKGTVPLPVLEQAFGSSSLGILVVTDLPSSFPDLRARVLSYSSYLANLPSEILTTLESPESKYLTGWSLGKESLKPGLPDTLKGSYYVNCAFAVDKNLSASTTTSPDGRDYSGFAEYTTPNVWPEDRTLPGFQQATEALCRLVIEVAALVARACDRYAVENIDGYEGGYLERMVKGSMSTKARLLHYFPPKTQGNDGGDDAEDDWCATHMDHGCLTGLTSAMYVDEAGQDLKLSRDKAIVSVLEELERPPDATTGLYIHSRAGAVTKVSIPRDALAFQTGEALERITEGRLKAVPHFVRGAAKGINGSHGSVARNTLAVFTQPNLWELVDRKEGVDYAGFARSVVEKNY